MLPQNILDQFARIPHNTTIENKYYGVFDKILNRVCFTEDTFSIQPQYPLPEFGQAAVGVPAVDFVVTYVVEVDDLPIFFLEIKPLLHTNNISSRVSADTWMRARFRALYKATPTPRLHGVSAMGQRLAFYCMDKAMGHVIPNYVALSTKYVTDTIPAERWETDITTEEGYQKLMEVVNDVKQMAAALH